MAYNGEGSEQITFSCDNIYTSWDQLKTEGLLFMKAPPETYYEMLEPRLLGHGEPIDELQSGSSIL